MQRLSNILRYELTIGMINAKKNYDIMNNQRMLTAECYAGM